MHQKALLSTDNRKNEWVRRDMGRIGKEKVGRTRLREMGEGGWLVGWVKKWVRKRMGRERKKMDG